MPIVWVLLNMTTDSPFTAGPRLTADPRGDPAAQAVASLRGYAYQLYVSALAWLDLRPSEALYLEVAQDYATVAGNALKAVQVKDTPSARVTINSEVIRDSIDGFVDLVQRNPDHKVFLHFLSSSEIGVERRRDHRTGDVPALLYWRDAARGADVAPLRAALSKVALSDRVRAFIDARPDDEALRRDLLRRLHWDCGQPSFEMVASELDAAITRFGAARLQVPAAEALRLVSVVLHRLLTTIVHEGPRRLTDLDLTALLEEATRVSLPRRDVDQLLEKLARVSDVDVPHMTVEARTTVEILEPESEFPLPANLVERKAMSEALCEKARGQGVMFINGATGTGKTIAARLIGRALSGRWYMIDLRNASPDDITRSLRVALGALGSLDPDGVILDDMNHIEEPSARAAFVRFTAALRRRDAFCLVTAYRPPSARALSEVGATQSAQFTVPDLTVEEVGELVASAGGRPETWRKAVHMAGAFGHPQLVQAVISGLQSRSWPMDELRQLWPLISSSDVDAERDATRQRLVAAVPERRRMLLYRLSLLTNRFDRPLALALAALAPAIPMPGEQLDALVGPWIDRTARDQMRISPLLSGAGRQALSYEEQRVVDRAAAENLVSGQTIDITTADSAFLHALLGKAERVLSTLAIGVLTTKEETRTVLAEWLTSLRLHRTDRPIYPDKTGLSLTLRLAQFLLVAEKREPKSVRACWEALVAEIGNEPDAEVRDHFEYLTLAKALNNRAAAGMLPNWVDLLLRFDRFTNASPERRELTERISKDQNGKPAPSPLGMFFILQALGVSSVADLASVFDRLDQLTAKERARLFADTFEMPGDFSMIVNGAWLKEHKRGETDWLACAAQYRRMADQARAWDYRELALRCHVAGSVMFDEYADDPAAALAALDEAKGLIGPHPVLSRARAKILYRQKDHLGALRLLREVSQSTALDDTIERAHMLREAGISAAEVGEWAEAREWFDAAHEASGKARIPEMVPMTIGLRADAAAAAYKSGDSTGAVAALTTAAEDLAKLDPDISLKSAYCHRVVRHIVLWLFGQATGEDLSVHGGPIAMVPGMCSNPEPPDISDLPLGPIDLIWYLLSESELALGVGVGVEQSLRARLKGRAIPALELGLRKIRLDAAILRFDATALLEHLPGWVDAQLYLEANSDVIRDQGIMEPEYGEIDPAKPEQLNGLAAVAAAEDLILAFGMFAWLGDRPQALAPLAAAPEVLGIYPGGIMAKVLLGGESDGERLQDHVAAHISVALSGEGFDPDRLFIAGLRFVQFVKQSNFKKLLTVPLVKWAKAQWVRVLKEQRFLLNSPMTTVTIIEDALDQCDESLGELGAVLLATEPAVKARLSDDFREYLHSL